MFGTYTLEKALFYYCENAQGWQKANEISCLEKEYVNSIIRFIK
jgi:hypothetical protein